ncbi:MAG: ABC transporter ATP-binding protein [Planctomycetes bacterium]|nr:ABC transporter ATP-binding protein [Planctomycetota bacterium]
MTQTLSTQNTKLAGLSGKDLTVRYNPKRDPVIIDQSIDIPVGKITVFVGPNGSGKSTLLKTLARQLAPESGAVILDGQEIITYSPLELARRIGILFQENAAPNDLTVEELAYHGRYPHRKLFESLMPEDKEAVEHALILSGADKLRHRMISQLSSGQKQLAWIAMLLSQSPKYMFLDEPTTFLDMAHQFDIMDLVLKLNRELGNTVLLSVHDLNLAARYADHIFALRDGRIVTSGSPAEVFTVETLREVFNVETRIACDEETGTVCCIPLGKYKP